MGIFRKAEILISSRQYLTNPAFLFASSFLFLILVGTFLLMLPIASTSRPIQFVDALFMSASAVCVTGLAVFDISKQLTPFGTNTLLILIQLGGLGIMTFTSFFAYLISGQSSFKNQVIFSELLNDKKVSSVIRTLIKIVLLTLFFELIGAILIFLTTSTSQFSSLDKRLYFSVFHAVSAFCNAGFSTFSAGIYDQSVRFNYPLQWVIAALLILGGLGFTIILNVQIFLKRWAVLLYHKVRYSKPIMYKAWIMTFNSRLIAYTTFFLLLFGTTVIFLVEYNSILKEHTTFFGKFTTAFFASASPRTAGFNTFDMASLSIPSVLLIMLLMWIGASPGSTGGGIRTTTFAVAVLNIFSTAKNYKRIHVFGREVPGESINKAFAVISVSIIWLSISIFFLSITDPDKDILSLSFESVSAYSTVGLSLGITPALSTAGKLIITLTMFTGRVGTITLLVALIKSLNSRKYQLPQEQVIF